MVTEIIASIALILLFCVWLWLIIPGVQERNKRRQWVQQQMEKDDLQKMQK